MVQGRGGGGRLTLDLFKMGLGIVLFAIRGEIFCLMGKLIGNSGKGWKQRKPLELRNAAA